MSVCQKIYILLLFALSVNGQEIVNGRVLDFITNEPIENVNITIGNTTRGTNTNAIGEFSISLNKTIEKVITFSLVGYQSRKFETKSLSDNFSVLLQTRITDLEEFVVKPGENPAWELIRKVQEREKFNNPLKYASFQANFYSKSKVQILNLQMAKDSINSKGVKYLNAMLTENSGVFYAKKGMQKEVVKRTISNIPKMLPTNLLFSNQLNPLGFYESFYRFNPGLSTSTVSEIINERNYINPIKSGSFSVYDFELKDTLINGNDSLFTIAFKPYQGKSTDALEGKLRVSSKGFAIQYIEAKPADTQQVLDFLLKQSYEMHLNKWYPTLREIKVSYPIESKTLNAIANIEMETHFTSISDSFINDRIFFDGASRVIEPKADTLSIKNFEDYRLNDLSPDEVLTYERSQMKEKPILKKGIDFMELPSKVIMQAAAPIGPFVLLFNQFNSNYHEKIRVGLGIQNNLLTNPRFGIKASAGYSLWDKTWKYETSAAWHITKDRYNRLSIYKVQDIQSPGQTNSLGPNYSTPFPIFLSFNPKGCLVDLYKTTGIALRVKPIKWTWFRFYAEDDKRQGVNYNVEQFKSDVKIRTYGVNFRFAAKEAFVRNGLFEQIVSRNFPIIHFNLQKSYNLNQSGNFVRSDFIIKQQLRWKKIGTDLLTLSGGYGLGEIPYNYLFNNLGAGRRLFGGTDNGFVTGNYTQYAFNQFVNFNWIHNFGKNIFRLKTKWSQPDIAFGHRFAWSLLSNDNQVSDLVLKDFSNGNFEANLYINSIIRIPILGMRYGIGLKMAYNYSKGFIGKNRFVVLPTIGLALF